MNGLQMVLFADGTADRTKVYINQGACCLDQPTAYVYRDGQRIWVRPGGSVAWVQV